jgi:hypothetical protein
MVAEGRPRLSDAAGHGRIETRSYDCHGRVFIWTPPPTFGSRIAIDVEHRDTPSLSWMAGRFGLDPASFLRRWTATEVMAKLLDEPILSYLEVRGLADESVPRWTCPQPGLWVRAVQHPTHWVTVGVACDGETPGEDIGSLVAGWGRKANGIKP